MKPLHVDVAILGAGTAGMGRLARGGHLPLGYYKDEAKSARTFREIDGVRYSFPGDMARVEADGTVVLLGRGSACINTGGEKVYPEEVEEALKTHPAVADAAVVGLPDDRFGQAITAIVVLRGASTGDATVPTARGSAAALTLALLRAHGKGKLAPYKLPTAALVVDAIPKNAMGKVNKKELMARFFPQASAPAKARQVQPSARGELEITTLLELYLAEGTLTVRKMGRGYAWLDTGTHGSMLDAGNFVRTLQERQGLQTGSPEEIAFEQGWISADDLRARAKLFKKNDYGAYLFSIAQASGK